MSSNVFEINTDDLKNLDEKQAVKIFRKLLFAEAYRLNLPTVNIQITTNTKEADGGIDALVSLSEKLKQAEDLLINGKASYQIKADNKFKGFSELSIYNELLGVGSLKELKNLSNEDTNARLKTSIKNLINDDYCYALVSFKSQFAGNKKHEAVKYIKTIFEKAGYQNVSIKVFDATNLMSIINRHLSVVYDVRPFPEKGIYSINETLNNLYLNENFYDVKENSEIKRILEEDFLVQHIMGLVI